MKVRPECAPLVVRCVGQKKGPVYMTAEAHSKKNDNKFCFIKQRQGKYEV